MSSASPPLAPLLAAPVAALHVQQPVAIIGDIHGRSDLLRLLLQKLDAQGSYPIIVAGDLCDRGPDTRGVLDLLIERGAEGVLGNHDLWLRRWARGEGFDTFALHPAMGGIHTLASYGPRPATIEQAQALAACVPTAHRDWLSARPIALALTVSISAGSHAGAHAYWIVHAGLPPEREPDEPSSPRQRIPWLAVNVPEVLLWKKTAPQHVPRQDRTVVMGHVPIEQPYDGGHTIAIDTGAGSRAWGRLTAVILPERRFVTVCI